VTDLVHDRRHPPFEAGNVAALKHGARSPRTVATLAARIEESLLHRVPRLRDHPDVVAGYVEVAAIAALYARDMQRRGLFDENGEIREGMAKNHLAYRRLALQYLRELGLTPKVQVELQLDLALTARATAAADEDTPTPRTDAYLDAEVVTESAAGDGEVAPS
jgi:hypothetical protein